MVVCPDCDTLLEDVPADYACPTCHGMRRSVRVAVAPLSARLTMGRVRVTVTHAAVKKAWPLILIVAALTLGTPFLGLVPVLGGWPGVFVNLVLNVAGAVAGYKAITQIITIRE